MDAMWVQVLRIARALDDANRAGNKNAAQIHHQALMDLLQRIKTEMKKSQTKTELRARNSYDQQRSGAPTSQSADQSTQSN